MRKAFVIIFTSIVLLGQVPASAQQSPPTAPDSLTERLAGLGRLWGAVKFFHPYLAYKDIDWDSALVKAIPLVRAARTPTEYQAAINSMLEVLSDPQTTAELRSSET